MIVDSDDTMINGSEGGIMTTESEGATLATDNEGDIMTTDNVNMEQMVMQARFQSQVMKPCDNSDRTIVSSDWSIGSMLHSDWSIV